MSMIELAEQLRAIASSDRLPIGLINEAKTGLAETAAAVGHVLGQMTSEHALAIAGALSQAEAALDNALALCQHAEHAIHDAADYHSR